MFCHPKVYTCTSHVEMAESVERFLSAGRAAYIHVDLVALTNNINILRRCCPSESVGVIAVVKAGAYGHGSVQVSRHLKTIGVERLAVATLDEALHLRTHSVSGPIHIFGNVQAWEMESCLQHGFIPTISDSQTLAAMGTALHAESADGCSRENVANSNHNGGDRNLEACGDINGGGRLAPPRGSINIKVDTGMSRNGCQVEQLQPLIQLCEELAVPLDGVFTHFADSPDNPTFTQQQLKAFLDGMQPHRQKGIHLHVANSGAIINGYGTNLDFIRPGIAMYGLAPGDDSEKFQALGFKPLASIKCIPTLVKQLDAGRHIGYSCTYTTKSRDHMATFPVGYADGYWRHLSGNGVIVRDKTGEKCPVVGRVSMDAISVKLPGVVDETETFSIMTADFDPDTSASGIAKKVGTIGYEVLTRMTTRYPRLYTSANSPPVVVPALSPQSY